MRGLPLDKQKYVDDLILTEEKFYKEGIMVPEVAMGQFVNDVKKIMEYFLTHESCILMSLLILKIFS